MKRIVETFAASVCAIQGRINHPGGGAFQRKAGTPHLTSPPFCSPFFPSPSLPALRLEVGPLNPARGSGGEL